MTAPEGTSTRRALTPLIGGIGATLSTLILVTSAITVMAPDTPLSRIWDVKRVEYQQLLAIGWPVGAGFLVLAVIALITAVGMFRRRRWAWLLAVAALAVNALSDALRMMLGSPFEGGLGVVIAGALLWWMLRPSTRTEFE